MARLILQSVFKPAYSGFQGHEKLTELLKKAFLHIAYITHSGFNLSIIAKRNIIARNVRKKSIFYILTC